MQRCTPAQHASGAWSFDQSWSRIFGGALAGGSSRHHEAHACAADAAMTTDLVAA
jgi:hypothetical protein